MDIVRLIFQGRELTLCKQGAILNKWRLKESPISIPLHITNYLINNEVLVLDSGNWETGEEHYVYAGYKSLNVVMSDRMYDELKSVLRELNLNKLCN